MNRGPFAGLFAIPGLIDGHVHLTLDGGSSVRTTFQEASDDNLVRLALGNARTAAKAGVTLVRDCGWPRHLSRVLLEALRSDPLLPDVLSERCSDDPPWRSLSFFRWRSRRSHQMHSALSMSWRTAVPIG